jgi:hypothetical protein
MLCGRKAPWIIAFVALGSVTAHADPTASNISVLASGVAVGGTQPDSVTIGDGSVWIEYGNGADSTGAGGSSTIVQYNPLTGAVQSTYSIAGSVDGLKFNPATGTVWALQNQDDNSALSIINPATHAVTPYAYDSSYTPGQGRGFDDVAFLGKTAFLSFTNPVNPTDPVVEQVTHLGAGSVTISPININAQTINPNFTSSSQAPPDTDSLKSTWFGDLVLTSEGDSPGAGVPPPLSTAAVYSLIANPGAANPTVTNVFVKNNGVGVDSLDDVIFPSATSGWLYVASTSSNQVYKLWLSGLNPNDPIIAIGSLDEVAVVDPATGNVVTPLLTSVNGLDSPHGMEFAAAPEPSAWAMMLIGFAGLGFAGWRAGKARQALA